MTDQNGELMLERTLYKVEKFTDFYDSSTERDVAVKAVSSCEVVSSRLNDKLHAPVLDLDYPVQVTLDDAGRRWLVLPRPLHRPHHTKLMARLSKVGLAPDVSGPAGVLRHDDATVAQGETIQQLVADGHPGGWSSLREVAGTLTQRPAGDVVDADELRLLPLPDQVTLVASSTAGHWHLFLEQPITKRQHKKLLKLLAEAGVIEEGYARMSIQRGNACVRRPGLMKVAPTPYIASLAP